MRTFVEHDPRQDVYRVWCWDVAPDRMVVSYYTRGGQLISTPHAEGTSMRDLPATFTIPYEVVEELVTVFTGRGVGLIATEALDDTRKVRDRLLNLVERLACDTIPSRGGEEN